MLGALIERFLMRRFEQGDPDTAVVVTIGLLTLITGLCGWIWSYNNLQFPSLFPLQTVNIARRGDQRPLDRHDPRDRRRS